MPSRIEAISGAASSVDSEESTVAPRNAPIAPGTPSLSTMLQSMFLNRQCDSPDASVVPTSARCTAALACAEATPLEHQQGRCGDTEGHAQRTIDQLGPEADEREDQKRTHRFGCFRLWSPGDLMTDGRGSDARATPFVESHQPARRPERLESSKGRRRGAVCTFSHRSPLSLVVRQTEQAYKSVGGIPPMGSHTVSNRYSPIRPTTTITARSAFGDSRRP